MPNHHSEHADCSRKNTWLSLLLVAAALSGYAAEQPLLDWFPPSTAPAGGGETTFSTSYEPSGSSWAQGLDERQVFQAEIAHSQDKTASYRLRIGKGGQIYSLRGAFGESVPPSWRDPQSPHQSPWNDEVWQFVAVDTRHNGLAAWQRLKAIPDKTVAAISASAYANTFFVHNSGAYVPGDKTISNLYCPQFAASYAKNQRAYRMINLGLVPQIKTIHLAPLLYYTQVRDLGDGVIELTWLVHNFGSRQDVVFDYQNAPWGGFRASSLPIQKISDPDGHLRDRRDLIGDKLHERAINVAETGGWYLASQTEAADSPAIALVYGRDRHWPQQQKLPMEKRMQLRPTGFRSWQAYGKKRAGQPENDHRNYEVIEATPKLHLKPGTVIWYRSYLVVNGRDRAVELAKALVDHVDYGYLEADPATTPLVAAGIAADFKLFSRPVPGSVPVFLLEDRRTNRPVVTTDPYLLVESQPLDWQLPSDHPAADYVNQTRRYNLAQTNTRWQRLLGFALREKPADAANWQRLSARLPENPIAPTTAANLDPWVHVP